MQFIFLSKIGASKKTSQPLFLIRLTFFLTWFSFVNKRIKIRRKTIQFSNILKFSLARQSHYSLLRNFDHSLARVSGLSRVPHKVSYSRSVFTPFRPPRHDFSWSDVCKWTLLKRSIRGSFNFCSMSIRSGVITTSTAISFWSIVDAAWWFFQTRWVR